MNDKSLLCWSCTHTHTPKTVRLCLWMLALTQTHFDCGLGKLTFLFACKQAGVAPVAKTRLGARESSNNGISVNTHTHTHPHVGISIEHSGNRHGSGQMHTIGTDVKPAIANVLFTSLDSSSDRFSSERASQSGLSVDGPKLTNIFLN